MKPESVGRAPGFSSRASPAIAARAVLSSAYCSTVPTVFLWYKRLPLAAVSDQRICQTAEPRLRLIRPDIRAAFPILLPAIAEQDAADDLYFDRVSQIRMDPPQGLWSRGRVTLIGDAASCVSLLAGQGTALAMVAAYILAGELHHSKGNYAEAFRRYQDAFGPFVLAKQKAALRFAGSFAPKSKLSLFLRNRLFNLMSIRWIADLAVGRDLADRIALPDY
jgi:2-polyprenyl-6-methoxyphenol hydroxylase-like FAD-dependent oxidoreductase